MSLTAAVRTWVVILALPGLAAARDTSRKVAVPDHGAFEVSMPSQWRYSTERQPEERVDTLRFEPESGATFVLLVTPAWVPEGNRDAKSAATWMRVRVYNQTVEQDIPIEEFKGGRNTFYWFAATDRNPKPGDHEAMVQGAGMVGDLLVGFTLLHHAGAAPERAAVLKALGEARHLAAAP